MRQALASNIGSRRASRPMWRASEGYIPAPVSGWDTDTDEPELPETHARVFDNWMPRGISVRIREGYSEWVTGGSTKVETLMAYASPSGTALFAAAGASIYDVSTNGALGSAVVGSLTSARFSYTNLTNSAGAFLYICNGADQPRYWNGVAWAVPSLSLTTYADTDIIFVNAFKERLFFLFGQSLDFGYLATQAISGTVANFPLGAVFNYGGHLIAMGSVSLDGGAGIDDNAVFLTSQGEIAVYQGTNPGDAAAWSLVGTYYVGEPIGDRPLVELGDDLGIITTAGLVSVKRVMATSAQQSAPLSDIITTGWQDLAIAGKAFDGWEATFYPARNILIVNTPTSASTAEQIVRYRQTGGWGHFTGWDFACFEVSNGQLYAGGFDGVIYKVFDGYDDNGADITAAFSIRWTKMGRPEHKTLLEAHVVITAVTRAVVRLIARTDFRSTPALRAWPTSTITNALIWGTGIWGTNVWGGQDLSASRWRAISGEGHAVSIVLEARSNQSPLDVNGINIRYKIGGQV